MMSKQTRGRFLLALVALVIGPLLMAAECENTGGGGSSNVPTPTPAPNCGDGFRWEHGGCKAITYTRPQAQPQSAAKPTRTFFELTQCIASGNIGAKCLFGQ